RGRSWLPTSNSQPLHLEAKTVSSLNSIAIGHGCLCVAKCVPVLLDLGRQSIYSTNQKLDLLFQADYSRLVPVVLGKQRCLASLQFRSQLPQMSLPGLVTPQSC